MQMNLPAAKLRATPRIFQIGYDEEAALQQTELLKSHGYSVICVIGNLAATVLLSSPQHYDLFIVGHSAPEETGRAMVDWLKANYPKVEVFALNLPGQELPGADYNVQQNGPENWLLIISRALASAAGRELNNVSTARA